MNRDEIERMAREAKGHPYIEGIAQDCATAIRARKDKQ